MDADADLDLRRRRVRYRADHRGTREADILIGGFVTKYLSDWNATELAWADALLAEQDVDIMAWAIGKAAAPERFAGPQLDALRRLDFIAENAGS